MCVRKIRKILIVDDNPDLLTLLTTLLKRKGYEVAAASGGGVALDLVDAANRSAQPFDVVILDWAMPQMSGLETAIRLRDLHALGADEEPVRIEAFTGHMELDIPESLKDKVGIHRTWSKAQVNEMIDAL